MMDNNRHIVIMAGPNGAGKSTSAPFLLRDCLAVDEYINADVIAKGLSFFHPESAALEAGRVILGRIRQLVQKKVDFAFETTLASRAFAPWLKRLSESGYDSHLVFLALSDAETAIARVASRVRMGGHHVPAEVIRRRYDAGIRNFFQLYMPIVTTWKVFDNSQPGLPVLFADGGTDIPLNIRNNILYEKLLKGYDIACQKTR
ncbi:MAG: zeta toxin family protein [Deltaproteobacteria bacterium]|jgi:predicted ABC-type ATPase|nr:zeta toxin family protein [Deltaproteobacteria bacterium]